MPAPLRLIPKLITRAKHTYEQLLIGLLVIIAGCLVLTIAIYLLGI